MMVDPCIAYDAEGTEYREFSCVYPQLDRFYFSFEKKYDPIPLSLWMEANNWLPVAAVSVYAILCWRGQVWMKDHDRWHWRYILTAWNFGLSLFSFVGMMRTAPNLLHNLVTMSLEDNMCADPRETFGSGSTGLWVQLFILSKFPELFDTFFIVIHKKPLIFLHWYHHITVLLYCWHSYVSTSPPGIFFVVMNYSVHASMYFYYGLMALRMKPKWMHPMIITSFQISQMIVGVAVTCAGFYYYLKNPGTCMITGENNTAAFCMYGSYLFLFLQFFLGRYFGPPKKGSKSLAKKVA
uniref:Elongation of fatty acids protein n=1 Tax=Grammatophora oceanica TaxID=210454 RepID=A0A7S1VJD7_9STRA|mmetsp:Transcript_47898/g.71335  ORF Transcript_47898/g.71335 Transcript_47898/m.71335 type:complete len:295 (+) Transcript_47898:31-915(+)